MREKDLGCIQIEQNDNRHEEYKNRWVKIVIMTMIIISIVIILMILSK